MINKINPLGQVQDVEQVRKVQKQHEEADTKNTAAIIDEVVLSEEAISMSEAESAARQISQQLSDNQDVALSGNETRLSELI